MLEHAIEKVKKFLEQRQESREDKKDPFTDGDDPEDTDAYRRTELQQQLRRYQQAMPPPQDDG